MKIIELFEHSPFDPIDPPEGEDQYYADQIEVAEMRWTIANQQLTKMFSQGIIRSVPDQAAEREWVRMVPWSRDSGIKKEPNNAQHIKRAKRYLKQFDNAIKAVLGSRLPSQNVADVKHRRLHFIEQRMGDIDSEAHAIYVFTPTLFTSVSIVKPPSTFKNNPEWMLVYWGNNKTIYSKVSDKKQPMVQHMIELNVLYHKYDARRQAIMDIPEHDD